MKEEVILKNWGEFQHYSGRRPPWIKLHFNLLTDRAFMSLSEAMRWRICSIWLWGSQRADNEGKFILDTEDFEWATRQKMDWDSIFETGFVTPCLQRASKTISPCTTTGSEEGETEGEREKNKTSSSSTDDGPFVKFWKAYPKKVGKQAALRAFKKIRQPASTIPAILDAVERQKHSDQWRRDNGQFIPNPATWLNQGRWEDEIDTGNNGTGPPPMTPDQRANLQAVIDMRKREGLDTSEMERRLET